VIADAGGCQDGNFYSRTSVMTTLMDVDVGAREESAVEGQ
jgi:hypothetical protein